MFIRFCRFDFTIFFYSEEKEEILIYCTLVNFIRHFACVNLFETKCLLIDWNNWLILLCEISLNVRYKKQSENVIFLFSNRNQSRNIVNCHWVPFTNQLACLLLFFYFSRKINLSNLCVCVYKCVCVSFVTNFLSFCLSLTLSFSLSLFVCYGHYFLLFSTV